MEGKSVLFSVLLHAAIIVLLCVNFSFFGRDDMTPVTSVPLIVDLKDVQIADKTNMPPLIQKTPTRQQAAKAPAPQPKPVEPAPVKPIEKAVANAVQAIEKTPAPTPTPKKTPEPVRSQPKETPKQNTAQMQALLASVDKIKRTPTRTSTSTPALGAVPAAPTEVAVNRGVEGGTGGSYDQPLSISERDLIASKLRSCWNVDAGVAGIEDMVVEVKASVNKDGRVTDVRILNMTNEPTFRSVAESARRAVYICDSLGPESPFRLLADKYGDKYSNWREVYVRFNPIDGGVF